MTVNEPPPADNRGADVAVVKVGAVTTTVVLIRQNCEIVDHTFEICFLDPGAPAYAFISAKGADR
jgi:hypothetical protein